MSNSTLIYRLFGLKFNRSMAGSSPLGLGLGLGSGVCLAASLSMGGAGVALAETADRPNPPGISSGERAAADGGRAPLRMGIVPQQSATRLAQIWVPVADHISRETGLDIRFATTRDIPTFEACLGKTAYDIAYMNPYHYTVFQAQGYQAIAHQSAKRLKGIVVVRKDSPAATLSDLSGQNVAFPSPAAFGASVLPRAEMRTKGIVFTPRYVRSHDSVYRAVVAGLMPAGGGVLRTFGAQSDAVKDQLRIVYQTSAYTPHAFAVHRRLAPETAELLQAALTALPARLLKELGMKGIDAAADQDWDDVRALGLTQQQTEIRETGDVTCHSD